MVKQPILYCFITAWWFLPAAAADEARGAGARSDPPQYAAATSSPTKDPPRKIDVSSLVTSIDDVVIPVPSEIFNALEKLGATSWATEVRVDQKTRPQSRLHLALLFGTVVADGFLAVQAKDADKVKKIGRRVLDLAAAMGVRSSVVPHSSAIIDAADRGNWALVRTELDKTQSQVKDLMEKLKSHEESELVSIGGWLRGTEALTNIVSRDYTAKRAELLHQPDLLTTFSKQLSGMRSRTRNDPLIGKLQSGLAEIRPLIPAEARIEKPTVEQINTVVRDLVQTISPPAAVARQ